MNLLEEVCPGCKPERFRGVKVTDPSDKKIWSGYEVEPERYSSRDSENTVHAKDELLQDVWNDLGRDLEQEAIELKRRTRRTEPMSATEIDNAKAWGNNVLRPALEEAARS